MIRISRTHEKQRANAMHSHKFYEVILYTKGNGYIFAGERQYPFKEGTIVILPPDTKHCSKAEDCYESIYLNGELEQFFHLKEPVILSDNQRREGTILANMIYNNRFSNSDFLSLLCSSYIHFILQNIKVDDSITIAVNNIICRITDNFHNSSLCLRELLAESGYAEDYIRAHFKRITSKTPNEFLTDIRIRHACVMMETYDKSLSLAEVSEHCGYTDYVYFSKKFKSVTGSSPKEYRNEVLG